MQVEGGEIRRPVESGRIERAVVVLGGLGALGWIPYMITWWMAHGWPPYPEAVFVGLVVFPAAIFGAGRLIATGITQFRRWRQGRTA